MYHIIMYGAILENYMIDKSHIIKCVRWLQFQDQWLSFAAILDSTGPLFGSDI